MRQGMVIGILAVLAGSLRAMSFADNPSAIPSLPIEGTRWSVTVTPDDIARQQGEQPFEDTLVFRHGAVAMTACLKRGFDASAYTLTPSGERWSFITQQFSKREGEAVWVGEIAGETMTGQMVWTKKDGMTILHYTFDGHKAASSKKPRS